MNPTDLARTRFKPIRAAFARIEKVERAHTAAVARLQELRAEIGPAEGRDRAALAEALIDGKREPAPEAEQLRAEVEQQERRVDALVVAIDRARAQIPKLVDENRTDWRGQAMRELAREQQRYRNAINELEAAREALNNAATLVSWLDSGDLSEASTDALGGRVNTSGRPALAFSRALEELRADAEALGLHPVTRDDPAAEPRYELAWRG